MEKISNYRIVYESVYGRRKQNSEGKGLFNLLIILSPDENVMLSGLIYIQDTITSCYVLKQIYIYIFLGTNLLTSPFSNTKGTIIIVGEQLIRNGSNWTI